MKTVSSITGMKYAKRPPRMFVTSPEFDRFIEWLASACSKENACLVAAFALWVFADHIADSVARLV